MTRQTSNDIPCDDSERRKQHSNAQDINTGAVGEQVIGADETVVPETSGNPAEQVRADAQRPLYEPAND